MLVHLDSIVGGGNLWVDVDGRKEITTFLGRSVGNWVRRKRRSFKTSCCQ